MQNVRRKFQKAVLSEICETLQLSDTILSLVHRREIRTLQCVLLDCQLVTCCFKLSGS